MLAKVERGERGVSLEEFFLLAVALLVPLAELMPERGAVQLTPKATIDAAGLRLLLTNAPVDDVTYRDLGVHTPHVERMAKAAADFKAQLPELQESVIRPAAFIESIRPGAPLTVSEMQQAEEDAQTEVVVASAKALRKSGYDVEPVEAALLARHLWDRSLVEERERRLAGEAPTRGRRGHVTRALLHELELPLKF